MDRVLRDWPSVRQSDCMNEYNITGATAPLDRTLVPKSNAAPRRKRNRRPQSPETREKIRLTLLGRKHTDERRQNISDALI